MCRISNQYVLHTSDIDHSPQGQVVAIVTVMNGELNKNSIQHVIDRSESIPTKVTFVRLLSSDNYICTGNENISLIESNARKSYKPHLWYQWGRSHSQACIKPPVSSSALRMAPR